MNTFFVTAVSLLLIATELHAQPIAKISRSDLRKDVKMVTDSGVMILRLNDSTPLHRDNFIRLIKSNYYEGISFHRVIAGFVIQAGDGKTKSGFDTTSSLASYTVPAEIRKDLYHKRGVLAAARMGDNVNPERKSSGVQFYIVQGKVFNDRALDSVEIHRLGGRKLMEERRQVYKTSGGAPHLDQTYTIFGELVRGYGVLDRIANTPTSGRQGGDRPLTDIRIKKTSMVRRKE